MVPPLRQGDEVKGERCGRETACSLPCASARGRARAGPWLEQGVGGY